MDLRKVQLDSRCWQQVLMQVSAFFINHHEFQSKFLHPIFVAFLKTVIAIFHLYCSFVYFYDILINKFDILGMILVNKLINM